MAHYIWQKKEWPNFKWDNNAIIDLLSQCNFKRGQLMGRVNVLGIEHSLEAQAVLLAAEVLETSAIEGKNFDPESVRSSVARRLGFKVWDCCHRIVILREWLMFCLMPLQISQNLCLLNDSMAGRQLFFQQDSLVCTVFLSESSGAILQCK